MHPPIVKTSLITDPASFKATLRILAEPSGNIFSDKKSIAIVMQPFKDTPDVNYMVQWTVPRSYVP